MRSVNHPKARKANWHKKLLDIFTVIEIVIYRCAVIAGFIVYAIKHIRAEVFGP